MSVSGLSYTGISNNKLGKNPFYHTYDFLLYDNLKLLFRPKKSMGSIYFI